jgi:hypothetical protein
MCHHVSSMELLAYVTPWCGCYISSYSISTVLTQCLLRYKPKSMKMVFSINEVDHLNLIGKFEFSNSCVLWTIKLSLKIFRINWSRIRPHFQKTKSSSQLVLQVCKFAKIHELKKVFISRVQTELYDPVSHRWINV